MELVIGINLDNAAFHEDDPDVEEGTNVLRSRGVAHCLTRVVDRIDGISWTDTQDQIGDAPIFNGKILDEDGNTVGHWAIAAEPEDEALRARPSRHGDRPRQAVRDNPQA